MLINTARRRCTGKGDDVTHTNMHVRAHKNSYTDCWSEDYLVCDSCMKLSETRSTNALFRSSKGVVWVFCFLHYPSLAKQEPRQLFLLSMSAIDFFSFFATCKVLIITQLFLKILNTSLMYYIILWWFSYLTHSFVLRRKEARVACNTVITVKHILIECADLLEIRKKYFEEKSLYSLFRNVIPKW